MNKNFIISEEERRRILGIHENATKNQYLQIITEAAATAEEIKSDLADAFKTVPCVTKMGWDRIKNTSGAISYKDPNTGWEYFGATAENQFKPHIYKGTGDYNTKYNCNSKPFRKPAQSEQEILAGKTLRYGDKSPLVKTVQQLLKKSNKLSKAVEETETFDKTTKNAIISFQTANKLNPDGVVGKNTWAVLSKVEDTSTPEAIASKGVSPVSSSTTEKGLAQPSQEKPQDLMGTIKGIGDLATQRYSADKTQSPGQPQVAGQSGKTKEGTGIAKPEETSRNMSPF